MLRGVLLVLLLLLVLGIAWMFNRLVSLRVRARNAWADIDVQLKRRWDLVPALVSTVQGYAAHESRALQEVVAARSRAEQAQTTAERAAREAQVSRAFGDLLMLVEGYPDLKADQMFRSLHEQLVDIEDHLQSARRYYNAVVRDYNTMVETIPNSIIAWIFRFKPRAFFQLDDPAESAAPAVDLERL